MGKLRVLRVCRGLLYSIPIFFLLFLSLCLPSHAELPRADEERFQKFSLPMTRQQRQSNCSSAATCSPCVELEGCSWCLTGKCVQDGDPGCLQPYKECCDTYTDCGSCVSHQTCGYCENTGCRKGNATGPATGPSGCTTKWYYQSCPSSQKDKGISVDTILLGCGIVIGGVLALFVVFLLVVFVRRALVHRAAARALADFQRKRLQQPVLSVSDSEERDPAAAAAFGIEAEDDALLGGGGGDAAVVYSPGMEATTASPDSEYSSLAPLIKRWNIEKGYTDYATLKRIEDVDN
ncbi:hypothetical protein QOT17_011723 [Balamuthia mandrillaris]